jgi:hypothetical protein
VKFEYTPRAEVLFEITVAEAGRALITLNNMNKKLRDEILAPYMTERNESEAYGRFEDMPLSVLQRLIDLCFVMMGEWNNCLGVEEEFLPFLKRHPLFTAHGYAGHSEGDKNASIIVEGVERAAMLTKEEVIDFCNEFMRSADDIRIESNYAFCWYD